MKTAGTALCELFVLVFALMMMYIGFSTGVGLAQDCAASNDQYKICEWIK